jgi:hypothetical protein
MTFGYTAFELAFIVFTMFAAGFVKGVIAFAFPLVVVSLLPNVIDPAKAVALGLMPAFATSVIQVKAGYVLPVLKRFRLFIGIMIVSVFIGAAVGASLSRPVLLILLGSMCVGAALLFIFKPEIRIPSGYEKLAAAPFGVVAGFFAGLTSVFGPPVVMYAVALQLKAAEFVASVSAIFAVIWLVLIAAFGSLGNFQGNDFWLSALMCMPALAGLKLGDALRQRINQILFRKLVLAALGLSGLRLIVTNLPAM